MCESAHELAMVSVVISSVSEKLQGRHLALIEALQKFLLFLPAGRVSRATCSFLTPQLLVPPPATPLHELLCDSVQRQNPIIFFLRRKEIPECEIRRGNGSSEE